jgi:hypothetical protein
MNKSDNRLKQQDSEVLELFTKGDYVPDQKITRAE